MRTREEILAELKRLDDDERLHYPAANVFSNAVLALIQSRMEGQVDTLRWVLGMKKPWALGEKSDRTKSCLEE